MGLEKSAGRLDSAISGKTGLENVLFWGGKSKVWSRNTTAWNVTF
jgi:hypothetical protein